MLENTFKEMDKDKVIQFLNMVATKATFNKLDLKEIIQFYGLLSYMQTSLLAKIDANILDIEGIRELKKPEPKSTAKVRK